MFMKDLLFKIFKRKRVGGNNQFEIVYGMSVGEDEIYAPAFIHGRKVLVSRGDGWGRSVVKTVKILVININTTGKSYVDPAYNVNYYYLRLVMNIVR